MPQHLPKTEFDALKNMSQNKQTVIQKSSKVNSKVIVERDMYIKKMDSFSSNPSKSQKTAVKDNNFFNSITSQKKKRIEKINEKLADPNIMSKETQRHLKPVGTRPEIKYGVKCIKKCADDCPLFRLFYLLYKHLLASLQSI